MRRSLIAVGFLMLALPLACTLEGERTTSVGNPDDGSPESVQPPARGDLIFVRVPPGSHPSGRGRLFAIGPSAGDRVRQLAATPFANLGTFAASPNGRRVAFTRRGELWVARLDGSKAKRLSRTAGINGWALWSPDGRRLIYHRMAGVGGSGDTAHLVNADGTGYREIGLHEERLFTRAWWGPDGNRIYGMDGGKLGFPPSLHELDLTTGRTTLLVEERRGTDGFAVSALGDVLILRTVEQPIRRQLWLREDGGERLLAETRGGFWATAWSPDGSQIAAAVLFGDDDTSRLIILDPHESDDKMEITPATGAAGRHPLWSPDGMQLAFTRGRFPHDDVWIVDRDGAERRVTRSRAFEEPVAWLAQPAG
jgi:Tol biopolymer transport system component